MKATIGLMAGMCLCAAAGAQTILSESSPSEVIDGRGYIRLSESATVQKPWDDLPTAVARDQVTYYNVVLASAVAKAEQIVRKQREVAEDATTAQRQGMADQLRNDLKEAIAKLPGTAVRVKCIVKDVVRREEPREPSSDYKRLDTQSYRQGKARWDAYEAAKQQYREAKFIIKARVDWTPDTYLTPVQRQQVADAQRDYADRVREIEAEHLSRNAITSRLNSAKSWRDLRLDQVSGSSKPTYRVYLLTSDAAVLRWKIDDTRIATGVIYKATAWGKYPYAGVDVVLRLTELQSEDAEAPAADSGDNVAEPASDTAKDVERAKALMRMAGLYQQAGKLDLAAKNYQQVIDRYGATEQADTARKALEQLNTLRAPAQPE